MEGGQHNADLLYYPLSSIVLPQIPSIKIPVRETDSTTVVLFIWLYWLYWLYFVQFQKVIHENNPLFLCLSVFFFFDLSKSYIWEKKGKQRVMNECRETISIIFSLIHTIRMVDAQSTNILILWIITEDDGGNGRPSNCPFFLSFWVNPLLHTW